MDYAYVHLDLDSVCLIDRQDSEQGKILVVNRRKMLVKEIRKYVL